MMGGRLHRLREWFSLLPLLLLLAATYWLNLQVHAPQIKVDTNKRHDPDVIVNNSLSTTLDKYGQPHFILFTKEMRHYPDNDSTELDDLQLTSLYANRPDIYTTAKHGKVSSHGKEFFLHDDVKIVRAAAAAKRKVTFSSSYMHAIPDKDYMETDRPITMVEAHNIIHAVGMTFNNRTQEINLLAKVRSHHEIIRQ